LTRTPSPPTGADDGAISCTSPLRASAGRSSRSAGSAWCLHSFGSRPQPCYWSLPWASRPAQPSRLPARHRSPAGSFLPDPSHRHPRRRASFDRRRLRSPRRARPPPGPSARPRPAPSTRRTLPRPRVRTRARRPACRRRVRRLRARSRARARSTPETTVLRRRSRAGAEARATPPRARRSSPRDAARADHVPGRRALRASCFVRPRTQGTVSVRSPASSPAPLTSLTSHGTACSSPGDRRALLTSG
jgi:hypothetical protein